MSADYTAVPDFLERLKLDASADRAAIRRAYSRELKLLDPEREIAAFQWLRACFESALDWVAIQPAAGAVQPQAAAPSARSAPEPQAIPAAASGHADPGALATAVFERLLAMPGRHPEPGALNDAVLWRAEIEQRLADPELINFDARLHFEAMLVQMLANTFQEGHYALFLAAADLFDWNHDERRLPQFGADGSFVNAAIEERGMYRAQHELDKAQQRSVFERMRREAAPDDGHLMQDIVVFEAMRARFPHLMAMRAPAWKIAQWQDACRALRAAHGDAAFNVRSSHESALGASDTKILWVLAAVILICWQLAEFLGDTLSAAP